jgi:hypothetical protein
MVYSRAPPNYPLRARVLQAVKKVSSIVVDLVYVPLRKDEHEALQRVAAHYGLSPEATLKFLLQREDNYGQASVHRVTRGAPARY